MPDSEKSSKRCIWDIPQYRRQQLFLQRQIGQGTVSHAYLWLGASSQAGRAIANLFIKSLVCELDAAPCARCSQCLRWEAGTNSDVIEIRPVDDYDIGIEQIRGAIRSLSRRPIFGERRIILIDPADRMTLGAANSLLKALEEPASSAIIILLGGQRTSLPATIVSRCQLLVFGDNFPTENEASAAEYHAVISQLGSALSRAAEEQWPIVAGLLEDEQAAVFFPAAIEELLRDCLLSKFDQTRQTEATRGYRAAPLVARYSVGRLLKSLGILQRVKQDLNNYSNPQLVWENFFLKLNTI